MADKKIIQLDPAAALTINDLMMVCQDEVTGELLQADLGALRALVLGGANAGARIYFTSGVPGNDIGVDGDVAFDKSAKDIYSKVSGAWILQDNYGAPDAGVALIRFTSDYGTGGLAADGLTYQNNDLIDCDVIGVMVEITPLIRVEEVGVDAPGLDEYDYDAGTGTITFGAALPEGFRISITYAF